MTLSSNCQGLTLRRLLSCWDRPNTTKAYLGDRLFPISTMRLRLASILVLWPYMAHLERNL